LQIVEQCLDRTNVEHAGTAPTLLRHAGQHRDDRRFGLAASGRCQQQAVPTSVDWFDGLELRRPQTWPPERIDNVILDSRMQAVELAHSSMSSTETALAAARSFTVISDSTIVKL